MFRRSQVRDAAPADAARAMKGGAVLLDVREDHEWATGHAPGAVGVEAYHVAGGMKAWHAAGLPVVRNDGSPGAVA